MIVQEVQRRVKGGVNGECGGRKRQHNRTAQFSTASGAATAITVFSSDNTYQRLARSTYVQ